MAKLPFKINPDTELGTIETDKDLEEAITEQLKAQGYTDQEIKAWFEEADEGTGDNTEE